MVDPATVKVTLAHPHGNFLFNMAWGDAVIVAPESAGDNATKPIGTGPFKFVEWVKGDHVELAKNPDYWGTPVKLDKATFKFIADPTAAFSAMMAGDVDAFPNFPAPENPRAVQGRSALRRGDRDDRGRDHHGDEQRQEAVQRPQGPPGDVLRHRPKAIIDGAMFGYGTPIGSHFSPADPGYVDLTGMYPYDPDKAKALLKEAGYPDGFKVTLKLPPPAYARRGGEIIAQQLKAVGIDAQIINVEWAQWLADVFKQQGLRPDHRLPYRADGHQHLCARRLLLRLPLRRVQEDHGRPQSRHRSGQAPRASG